MVSLLTCCFLLELINYSDVEFQKFYLEKVQEFVPTKQVSNSQFSLLVDRVNINSGKPQIYGTQLTYDKDGNAIPRELKDAENVNKRRASVGLQKIEEYLKEMTEFYKKINSKKQ